MSELDELMTQLAINEENLPLEHREQATRYGSLGRLAARATAALGKAELQLRLFEAREDLRLRREGLPDGIKITETAVQSSIRSHPDYPALKEAVIAAQEEADVLNNLLKAFEIRGWSLRHLERTAGTRHPGDDDEILARNFVRSMR